MKPDQERVRNLLTDTVTLLCKNGLHYQKELRVQGLLGITLDNKDVFVVHINEKFGDLIGGAISLQADDSQSAAKLVSSDVGSSSDVELTGTMKARSRRKRRRRSGEKATPTPSSADDAASANQQFLQRPIKRLMTSTPYSSARFEKRTRGSVDDGADENADGPVGESAADADLPPPLDVNVKVKTEDDVMIIDDKSCVQSCDPGADPTYPGLSLNEIQSNYQHFEQILGLAETSGDPGGGDPAANRRATRDPYGLAGDIAAAEAQDLLPGVGGPFITGIMRNETGAHDATNSTWDASQISAHNSGYAADGQSLTVNSAVAGCSSWDPSQAAAAARQAVSGTEHDSESGHDKYPRSKLDSVAIIRAVTSQLLEPVLSAGDHVTAFRVTWRMSGEQLDAAWRTIITLRERLDAAVLRAPGVQFFVSSISGVYTKGPKGFTPTDIFPAINYWMVSDGCQDNDPVMTLMSLQRVVPDAAVKQIHVSRRRTASELVLLRAPLLVVFKDHNSRYIRRRIVASIEQLRLSPTAALQTPVKLVVASDGRYTARMRTACAAFKRVGLRVTYQIEDGDVTS